MPRFHQSTGPLPLLFVCSESEVSVLETYFASRLHPIVPRTVCVRTRTDWSQRVVGLVSHHDVDACPEKEKVLLLFTRACVHVCACVGDPCFLTACGG